MSNAAEKARLIAGLSADDEMLDRPFGKGLIEQNPLATKMSRPLRGTRFKPFKAPGPILKDEIPPNYGYRDPLQLQERAQKVPPSVRAGFGITLPLPEDIAASKTPSIFMYVDANGYGPDGQYYGNASLYGTEDYYRNVFSSLPPSAAAIAAKAAARDFERKQAEQGFSGGPSFDDESIAAGMEAARLSQEHSLADIDPSGTGSVFLQGSLGSIAGPQGSGIVGGGSIAANRSVSFAPTASVAAPRGPLGSAMVVPPPDGGSIVLHPDGALAATALGKRMMEQSGVSAAPSFVVASELPSTASGHRMRGPDGALLDAQAVAEARGLAPGGSTLFTSPASTTLQAAASLRRPQQGQLVSLTSLPARVPASSFEARSMLKEAPSVATVPPGYVLAYGPEATIRGATQGGVSRDIVPLAERTFGNVGDALQALAGGPIVGGQNPYTFTVDETLAGIRLARKSLALKRPLSLTAAAATGAAAAAAATGTPMGASRHTAAVPAPSTAGTTSTGAHPPRPLGATAAAKIRIKKGSALYKPAPVPTPVPPALPDHHSAIAIANSLQPFSHSIRPFAPLYVRATVNLSPAFRVRFFLSRSRFRALPRNIMAELFQYFETELIAILKGDGIKNRFKTKAEIAAAAPPPPPSLLEDASPRAGDGMDRPWTGRTNITSRDGRVIDATRGNPGSPQPSMVGGPSSSSLPQWSYSPTQSQNPNASLARGPPSLAATFATMGASMSIIPANAAAQTEAPPRFKRRWKRYSGHQYGLDQHDTDDDILPQDEAKEASVNPSVPFPAEYDSDGATVLLQGPTPPQTPPESRPESRGTSQSRSVSPRPGSRSGTEGGSRPGTQASMTRSPSRGDSRGGNRMGSAAGATFTGSIPTTPSGSRPATSNRMGDGNDDFDMQRPFSMNGPMQTSDAFGFLRETAPRVIPDLPSPKERIANDPDLHDDTNAVTAAIDNFMAFAEGEADDPTIRLPIDVSPVPGEEEKVEVESGPLTYRLLRLGVVDVESGSHTIQAATRVRHAMAYATPWSVYVESFLSGEGAGKDFEFEMSQKPFKLYDSDEGLARVGSDKIASKIAKQQRSLTERESTHLGVTRQIAGFIAENSSENPADFPGTQDQSSPIQQGSYPALDSSGSGAVGHANYSRMLANGPGSSSPVMLGGTGSNTWSSDAGIRAGGKNMLLLTDGSQRVDAAPGVGPQPSGLISVIESTMAQESTPTVQADGSILLRGPTKTAAEQKLEEVMAEDPFLEVLDEDNRIVDELFTSTAWYYQWHTADVQSISRQRYVYDDARAKDAPDLEIPTAFQISKLSVILMRRKGTGQVDHLRMAGHDGLCSCGCRGPEDDAPSARFVMYKGGGWLPPDPASASVLVSGEDFDGDMWRPPRVRKSVFDTFEIPEEIRPKKAARVIDATGNVIGKKEEKKGPKVPIVRLRGPGIFDKEADAKSRMYRSLPKLLREQIKRASHGGFLMPHPTLRFDKDDNDIVDLSMYGLDEGTVEILIERSARAAVFRSALWQGPILRSQILTTMATYMTHLRHLHIPGCRALTPTMCQVLAGADFAAGLLSLDLSLSPTLDDDGLKQLAMSCTNLRSLNLAGCDFISNESLLLVGDRMRKLRVMDISWCAYVDDAAIAHIIASADMRCLSLRGLGRSTYPYPIDAQKPAHLTAKDIARLRKGLGVARDDNVPVEDEDPSKKASRARAAFDRTKKRTEAEAAAEAARKAAGNSLRAEAWIANRRSLVTGKRAGEDGRWQEDGRIFYGGLTGLPLFTKAGYGHNPERLTKLVELDLEACLGVTDEVIISLVRSSGDTIQKLKLSFCKNITSVSTTILAAYAPALKQLQLAYCTGLVSPLIDLEYLRNITALIGVKRPRSAQQIALSRGRKKTEKVDRGLRNALTGPGMIAYMHSGEMDAVANATRKFLPPGALADEAASAFGRTTVDVDPEDDIQPEWEQAPEWLGLNLLDLSGLDNVDEDDVRTALESLSETIRDFRIMGMHHISGGIFQFMANAASLHREAKEVALATAQQEGTLPVLPPAPAFPLQNFYAAFVPRITDDHIMHLAQCCPDLRILEVTGNPNISNATIMFVADNCLHLRALHANDCSPTITAAVVVALAQRCRMLTTLEIARPNPTTLKKLPYMDEYLELRKKEELERVNEEARQRAEEQKEYDRHMDEDESAGYEGDVGFSPRPVPASRRSKIGQSRKNSRAGSPSKRSMSPSSPRSVHSQESGLGSPMAESSVSWPSDGELSGAESTVSQGLPLSYEENGLQPESSDAKKQRLERMERRMLASRGTNATVGSSLPTAHTQRRMLPPRIPRAPPSHRYRRPRPFNGDLKDMIVSIGICCPFLETLDISGHKLALKQGRIPEKAMPIRPFSPRTDLDRGLNIEISGFVQPRTADSNLSGLGYPKGRDPFTAAYVHSAMKSIAEDAETASDGEGHLPTEARGRSRSLPPRRKDAGGTLSASGEGPTDEARTPRSQTPGRNPPPSRLDTAFERARRFLREKRAAITLGEQGVDIIFPSLKKVLLRETGKLLPAHLLNLTATMPELSILDVTDCNNIQSDDLEALSKTKTSLKVISSYAFSENARFGPSGSKVEDWRKERTDTAQNGQVDSTTGGFDSVTASDSPELDLPDFGSSVQGEAAEIVEDLPFVPAAQKSSKHSRPHPAMPPGVGERDDVSIASEDATVITVPALPAAQIRALGLLPQIASCYGHDAELLTHRLLIEAEAIAKIKAVVMHALRKKGFRNLVWELIARLHRRRARRMFRVIVMMQRMTRAWLRAIYERKHKAAMLITSVFRRIRIINRLRKFCLAAIRMHRTANAKQTACCILLAVGKRVVLRRALLALKSRSAAERWRMKQNVVRYPYLAPQYAPDGSWKVQFILPRAGPDNLAEFDDQMHELEKAEIVMKAAFLMRELMASKFTERRNEEVWKSKRRARKAAEEARAEEARRTAEEKAAMAEAERKLLDSQSRSRRGGRGGGFHAADPELNAAYDMLGLPHSFIIGTRPEELPTMYQSGKSVATAPPPDGYNTYLRTLLLSLPQEVETIAKIQFDDGALYHDEHSFDYNYALAYVGLRLRSSVLMRRNRQYAMQLAEMAERQEKARQAALSALGYSMDDISELDNNNRVRSRGWSRNGSRSRSRSGSPTQSPSRGSPSLVSERHVRPSTGATTPPTASGRRRPRLPAQVQKIYIGAKLAHISFAAVPHPLRQPNSVDLYRKICRRLFGDMIGADGWTAGLPLNFVKPVAFPLKYGTQALPALTLGAGRSSSRDASRGGSRGNSRSGAFTPLHNSRGPSRAASRGGFGPADTQGPSASGRGRTPVAAPGTDNGNVAEFPLLNWTIATGNFARFTTGLQPLEFQLRGRRDFYIFKAARLSILVTQFRGELEQMRSELRSAVDRDQHARNIAQLNKQSRKSLSSRAAINKSNSPSTIRQCGGKTSTSMVLSGNRPGGSSHGGTSQMRSPSLGAYEEDEMLPPDSRAANLVTPPSFIASVDDDDDEEKLAEEEDEDFMNKDERDADERLANIRQLIVKCAQKDRYVETLTQALMDALEDLHHAEKKWAVLQRRHTLHREALALSQDCNPWLLRYNRVLLRFKHVAGRLGPDTFDAGGVIVPIGIAQRTAALRSIDDPENVSDDELDAYGSVLSESGNAIHAAGLKHASTVGVAGGGIAMIDRYLSMKRLHRRDPQTVELKRKTSPTTFPCLPLAFVKNVGILASNAGVEPARILNTIPRDQYVQQLKDMNLKIANKRELLPLPSAFPVQDPSKAGSGFAGTGVEADFDPDKINSALLAPAPIKFGTVRDGDTGSFRQNLDETARKAMDPFAESADRELASQGKFARDVFTTLPEDTAKAFRPIQQMHAILGPVIIGQKAKGNLLLVIPSHFLEKRKLSDTQMAIERAAQKRLKKGLVAKIKRAYQRHYEARITEKNTQQFVEAHALRARYLWSKKGVLEPAFVDVMVPDHEFRAAAAIQRCFRGFSSRMCLLRLRRAACVEKAKDLLLQLGVALQSNEDPLRSTALAAEVKKNLSRERTVTAAMRQTSLQFDKTQIAKESLGIKVDDLLKRMGQVIEENMGAEFLASLDRPADVQAPESLEDGMNGSVFDTFPSLAEGAQAAIEDAPPAAPDAIVSAHPSNISPIASVTKSARASGNAHPADVNESMSMSQHMARSGSQMRGPHDSLSSPDSSPDPDAMGATAVGISYALNPYVSPRGARQRVAPSRRAGNDISTQLPALYEELKRLLFEDAEIAAAKERSRARARARRTVHMVATVTSASITGFESPVHTRRTRGMSAASPSPERQPQSYYADFVTDRTHRGHKGASGWVFDGAGIDAAAKAEFGPDAMDFNPPRNPESDDEADKEEQDGEETNADQRGSETERSTKSAISAVDTFRGRAMSSKLMEQVGSNVYAAGGSVPTNGDGNSSVDPVSPRAQLSDGGVVSPRSNNSSELGKGVSGSSSRFKRFLSKVDPLAGRKAEKAASKATLDAVEQKAKDEMDAVMMKHDHALLRKRYAEGNMSFEELQAYRRDMDRQSSLQRLDLQLTRAVSMEGSSLRIAAEENICWSHDKKLYFQQKALETHIWKKHWHGVLQVMEDNIAKISTLSDPFIAIDRARLGLRIDLLAVTVEEAGIQELYAREMTVILERLEGWGKVLAAEFIRRFRKDGQGISKLKSHMESARRTLAFIDRRRVILSQQYEAWLAEERSKPENMNKRVSVMKRVVNDRLVPAMTASMSLSSSKAEPRTAANTALNAQSVGRPKSGLLPPVPEEGEEDTKSVASRPNKGQTWVAPKNALVASAPEGATSSAVDEKPSYNWRGTDEWVIRPTAGGKPQYIHLPTGTTLLKEPTAPPAGYVESNGLDGQSNSIISPSLVPSLSDAPMAPPPMSPSRVPGTKSTRFMDKSKGLELPKPIDMDERRVYAGDHPYLKLEDAAPPPEVNVEESQDGAPPVSPRSVNPKPKPLPPLAAKPKSTAPALKDVKADIKADTNRHLRKNGDQDEDFGVAKAAKEAAELIVEVDPEETRTKTSLFMTQRARAAEEARASAKKKALMDHLRAEIRWLTQEEALIQDSILRMEAQLRTISKQREDRAREELTRIAEVKKLSRTVSDKYEALSRLQHELLQVRRERITSKYAEKNKDILDMASRVFKGSSPRFGRIFAEPDDQPTYLDPCFLTASLPETLGSPDDLNYDPHYIISMEQRLPVHVAELERRRLARLARAHFQRQVGIALQEARSGVFSRDIERLIRLMESSSGQRKHGYSDSIAGSVGALTLDEERSVRLFDSTDFRGRGMLAGTNGFDQGASFYPNDSAVSAMNSVSRRQRAPEIAPEYIRSRFGGVGADPALAVGQYESVGNMESSILSLGSTGQNVTQLRVPRNVEEQRALVITNIGSRGCIGGEIMNDPHVSRRAAGIPAPKWLLTQFRNNHEAFQPSKESLGGIASLRSLHNSFRMPSVQVQKRGFDPAEWYIPKQRRAECAPTVDSIAYYSIGGDGEELGNAGFYYWGPDDGTVIGLFGVRMRFGTTSSACEAASARADVAQKITAINRGEHPPSMRSSMPGHRISSTQPGSRVQAPLRHKKPQVRETLDIDKDAIEEEGPDDQAYSDDEDDDQIRAAQAEAQARVEAEVAEAALVNPQFGRGPGLTGLAPNMFANTINEDADEVPDYDDDIIRLAFRGTMVSAVDLSRRLQAIKGHALKERKVAGRELKKAQIRAEAVEKLAKEALEKKRAAKEAKRKETEEEIAPSGIAPLASAISVDGKVLKSSLKPSLKSPSVATESMAAGAVPELSATSRTRTGTGLPTATARPYGRVKAPVNYKGVMQYRVGLPSYVDIDAHMFGPDASSAPPADDDPGSATGRSVTTAAWSPRMITLATTVANITLPGGRLLPEPSGIRLPVSMFKDSGSIFDFDVIAHYERDAKDVPQFWHAIGVRDEWDVNEPSDTHLGRGFAGGANYAGSEQDYLRNIANQEVHLLKVVKDTIAERQQHEIRMEMLMKEASSKLLTPQPFKVPRIIRTTRKASIAATDRILFEEWKEKEEAKAEKRRRKREADAAKRAGKNKKASKKRRKTDESDTSVGSDTDTALTSDSNQQTANAKDLIAGMKRERRPSAATVLSTGSTDINTSDVELSDTDVENVGFSGMMSDASSLPSIKKKTEAATRVRNMANKLGNTAALAARARGVLGDLETSADAPAENGSDDGLEGEDKNKLFDPFGAFKSGGFRGIVAPDGAILEWAGDGVEFKTQAWKNRYRLRPWVVDAALMKLLVQDASRGDDPLDDEAIWQQILAEGATQMLRTYKQGGKKLPPSGFDLVKQKVMDRREVIAAEAAIRAAGDARLAASRKAKSTWASRSLKSLATGMANFRRRRKNAKSLADTLRDLPGNVVSSIKNTKKNIREAIKFTKNLYYNARKVMLARKMKKNRDLKKTIDAVKRRQMQALNLPMSVEELAFTIGHAHSVDFAAEQRRAFDKLKPYFVCADGNIGSPEKPIYLWYRLGFDAEDMIGDIRWGFSDAVTDPDKVREVNKLKERGYKVLSDDSIIEGYGLWYLQGDPAFRGIGAITTTTEINRHWALESSGFRKMEGKVASSYVSKEAQVFLKDISENEVQSFSEVVRQTEIRLLEAQLEALTDRVKQLKAAEAEKGRASGPGNILANAEHDAKEAKAALLRRRKAVSGEKEEALAHAAIDFLGLKQGDVRKLTRIFESLDLRKKGYLHMREFWPFFEVYKTDRSPILDSIFYFLDPAFKDHLNFGGFLRSISSFCMFGADEMLNFAFNTVSLNLVVKAEDGAAEFRDPNFRPGLSGINRNNNKPSFWDDAKKWNTLAEEAGEDKEDIHMTIDQFCNLAYNIHLPTSAVVGSVKMALKNARLLAEKADPPNTLTIDEFKRVISVFPAFMQPLYQLQTRIRQKIMGEGWWAKKRQTFADARSIIREQFETLAKEQATRKAAQQNVEVGEDADLSALMARATAQAKEEKKNQKLMAKAEAEEKRLESAADKSKSEKVPTTASDLDFGLDDRAPQARSFTQDSQKDDPYAVTIARRKAG